MRLFILVILICIGLAIGAALMGGVAWLNGEGLSSLLNPEKMMEGSINSIRVMLLINHVTMFILPAIVWAIIHHKKNWVNAMALNFNGKWTYLFLGVLLIFVSYPIIFQSYEINKLWDLPEFLSNAETSTAALMKKLITMDSVAALVLNLIVIAVIPGIGEELIFRGIIQKELIKWFKNPYVAILFASILFSAIHFQFGGFLPRMLLGLVLGLVFYWSGSLIIPIGLHAFNNGLQVVLAYFNPAMADTEFEESIQIPWYVLLLSIIGVSAIIYRFLKLHASQNNIAENYTSENII